MDTKLFHSLLEDKAWITQALSQEMI